MITSNRKIYDVITYPYHNLRQIMFIIDAPGSMITKHCLPYCWKALYEQIQANMITEALDHYGICSTNSAEAGRRLITMTEWMPLFGNFIRKVHEWSEILKSIKQIVMKELTSKFTEPCSNIKTVLPVIQNSLVKMFEGPFYHYNKNFVVSNMKWFNHTYNQLSHTHVCLFLIRLVHKHVENSAKYADTGLWCNLKLFLKTPQAVSNLKPLTQKLVLGMLKLHDSVDKWLPHKLQEQYPSSQLELWGKTMISHQHHEQTLLVVLFLKGCSMSKHGVIWLEWLRVTMLFSPQTDIWPGTNVTGFVNSQSKS